MLDNQPMECPNCHAHSCVNYRKINSYNLLKCLECGLVHTHIPRRTNLSKVNIDYYNSTYVDSYSHREKKYIKRFKKNILWLRKYKNIVNAKFLDIGCGAGALLSIVKKDYSSNIYGIDANAYLVKLCKKRKLGIIKKASMDRLPFENDMFDCITCFDVLEHSLKFKRNMLEIKRVLRANGVLILQSPNHESLMRYACGDLWDWWSPPDHLIHFSRKTLCAALSDYGFILLYVKTYDELIDFVRNVKGSLRKRGFNKFNTIVILLAFMLLRLPMNLLGYGGLTFIIAIKIK